MTEHFTQKAAGELAMSCGAAVAAGSTLLMIEAHELQRLLNAAVNHKLKEWEAQEPVAWVNPIDPEEITFVKNLKMHDSWEPLYTGAPARTEKVVSDDWL